MSISMSINSLSFLYQTHIHTNRSRRKQYFSISLPGVSSIHANENNTFWQTNDGITTQHEHKHGTQNEHKHIYATSTQSHVRNMNTSARTQHEHKRTYAT